MRPSQFKNLMDTLDAAMDNGYEEVLEMEPEAVLDGIREDLGEFQFRDVEDEELCRAISGWQTTRLDRIDKHLKRSL